MAARSKEKPAAEKGKPLDIKQDYEIVKLDGETDPLKEHPQNPRQGVVAAIDESIDVNGWYGAVVAQKSTGFILAGNHRYRVAAKNGATEIPVIWLDVDDEAALRILLADNKTAELGGYDEDKLQAILDELGDLKGTGYGFTDMLAAEEEAEAAAADAEPEVPDDQHTPTYGIMIVLGTEDEQEAVYSWLLDVMEAELPEGAKLRVVAT